MIDAGLEEGNRCGRRAADPGGWGVACTATSSSRASRPATTVDAAAGALGGARAPVIVAIGGGSVIDTAKAARLCVQLGCRLRQLLARADRPGPGAPADRGADDRGHRLGGVRRRGDHRRASGRKAGIASPNLSAQYAIVDPVADALGAARDRPRTRASMRWHRRSRA